MSTARLRKQRQRQRKAHHQLIQQCIEVGSPFEALHAKCITPEEILEYLLVHEMTPSREIAYIAASSFLPPSQQYLLDHGDKHFITLKPSYTLLAQLLGQNIIEEFRAREFPGLKEEYAFVMKILEGNVNKESRIAKTFGLSFLEEGGRFIELHYEPLHHTDHHMRWQKLCSEGALTAGDPHLSDVIKARGRVHSGRESPLTHKALIEADWVEEIQVTPESFPWVVDRTVHLRWEAPYYWVKVARDRYTKLIASFLRSGETGPLNREVLHRLSQNVPGVVETTWLKMGELELGLQGLPAHQRWYALGFPLQIYEPTKEQEDKAIAKLVQVGPEVYIHSLAPLHASLWIPPFLEETCFQDRNTSNLLWDEIQGYNSFDVIPWYQGSKVTWYTRVEFQSILEKGEDPYTRTRLPLGVLSEMQKRLGLAEEYRLGPSIPLGELYEYLKKGELPPEEKESIPQEDLGFSETERMADGFRGGPFPSESLVQVMNSFGEGIGTIHEDSYPMMSSAALEAFHDFPPGQNRRRRRISEESKQRVRELFGHERELLGSSADDEVPELVENFTEVEERECLRANQMTISRPTDLILRHGIHTEETVRSIISSGALAPPFIPHYSPGSIIRWLRAKLAAPETKEISEIPEIGEISFPLVTTTLQDFFYDRHLVEELPTPLLGGFGQIMSKNHMGSSFLFPTSQPISPWYEPQVTWLGNPQPPLISYSYPDILSRTISHIANYLLQKYQENLSFSETDLLRGATELILMATDASEVRELSNCAGNSITRYRQQPMETRSLLDKVGQKIWGLCLFILVEREFFTPDEFRVA